MVIFFICIFVLSFSSEERKENQCSTKLDEKDVDEQENGADSSPAVLLDETPLPRMFIPGNIVHIYTHRGGKSVSHKSAFSVYQHPAHCNINSF